MFFCFFWGGVADVGLVCRQNVSRRYSFPLRAGHKKAYMCTETTMYRYMDSLEAPKKWFRSNVDSIMELYGAQRRIQKEDLFLGAFFFWLFGVWS